MSYPTLRNTTTIKARRLVRSGLRASLAVAACTFVACGGSGTSTPDDGFDRNAMLRSFSTNIITPTYTAFAQAVSDAEAPFDAYAEALDDGDEDTVVEARGEAQDAWRDMMRLWQRAELVEIGPAGSDPDMGGVFLRDEVYSWPARSPCRVNTETADESYASETFFEDAITASYGLDAMSYLLFDESRDHECPAGAPEGWEALSDAEIDTRRAAYIRVLRDGLAGHAQALADAWAEGSESNYRFHFSEAGESTVMFSSAQAAVDELFAALFYIDLQTTDRKLGAPAGRQMDCEKELCPELVELPVSGFSAEAAVVNMQTMRAFMEGSLDSEDASAVGFVDFLAARNAGGLGEAMVSELDEAIVLTQALEEPLDESITRDPEPLRESYAAIVEFTDLLRADFISVLNLRVPQEGAADND